MDINPQVLKDSVQTMVRRVIRNGRGRDQFDRDILTIAKQEMVTSEFCERETLVRIVTDRVCNLIRAREAGSTITSVELIGTLPLTESTMGSSC